MFSRERAIVREMQINEALETMAALNALRSETDCVFERALCSSKLDSLGAGVRLAKIGLKTLIPNRMSIC